MSSLDDISTRGDGDNGDKIPSNKKECTEQKVDDSKNDNKLSNNSADVDLLSGALHHLRLLNLRSETTTNDNDGEDDKLFQDPPPKEDCPVCMQPMPFSNGVAGVETGYQACCGKLICRGCILAEKEEIQKGNLKPWCAFCRVPGHHSNEDLMRRFEKRMKLNDADAFYQLGCEYIVGNYGLPRDMNKALELCIRAAELGSSNAYSFLGRTYMIGEWVEKDLERGIHHMSVAAIKGNETARFNLGVLEEQNGNMDRAMKHYMIAASAGSDVSLKEVGDGYKRGHVTKDDYARTLRAHKKTQDEMKSEQRAKALLLDP